MKAEELLELAIQAKKKAYVPYSSFRVGAALLTKTGRVFIGANIENASYGLTVCAERNAIFAAVLEGERAFESIAIVGSGEGYVFPCGACLQVMAEFSKDMTVIVADEVLHYKTFQLKELLPQMFTLEER
ncbi:MAG: cytidine deaminase [Bacillota bacterium]|nr:cytidine deaminase [Bacillota bacterium]